MMAIISLAILSGWYRGGTLDNCSVMFSSDLEENMFTLFLMHFVPDITVDDDARC